MEPKLRRPLHPAVLGLRLLLWWLGLSVGLGVWAAWTARLLRLGWRMGWNGPWL